MGAMQSIYRHARRARRTCRGRRQSGAVIVEFLFAIPIVLFLFFGIFELGRHYYTRLTLRHAVAEAARFAVTGRTLPDPQDPDVELTRAESIVLVMQQSAGNLGVDIEQIVITPADGGAPEEVVSVRVQYEYDFLFQPIDDVLAPLKDIVVTTAMKNEPAF